VSRVLLVVALLGSAVAHAADPCAAARKSLAADLAKCGSGCTRAQLLALGQDYADVQKCAFDADRESVRMLTVVWNDVHKQRKEMLR
jgi:hypothetical protein